LRISGTGDAFLIDDILTLLFFIGGYLYAETNGYIVLITGQIQIKTALFNKLDFWG
jgi:hypothetical protein